MSLSEVALIATAISGFTATASLIYVALQTRQNVRHTRALILQGTAARTTAVLLGYMSTESVTAWIEGNGGIPTPELIRQRQFFANAASRSLQWKITSASTRRAF